MMVDLNKHLADLEQRLANDQPERTHKGADRMQSAVTKAMDASLLQAELAGVEVRSFAA